MKNLIKKIVAGVSVTTMLFCGLSVTDERHSYNLTNLSANAEEGFYNSAEEFLESAYDESNVTIYNGNTKHSFNMNGRSFYQGIIFTEDSEVSYNVENVDSLKFTIGHIDGSGEMNVNFKIYLDDEEYDNFTLYKTMSLKNYDIDTSEAKVLRIVTSCNNYNNSNSYAFADFSVDSYNPPKTCSVPEYNSEADFMNSGFNISNMKVYDGSNKDNAFNMNGRSFSQGLVFTGNSEINYNVENVDSLRFTIGHVDDNSNVDVDFNIYLDDKEYDSFTLYRTMSLKEYDIDTSKAKVLRIVTSCGYGLNNSYAFADFSVDSYTPSKTYTVPEYDNEVDFMNSGFNISNMKVYDGSNKNVFNMNGRSFYQGLVFTNSGEVNYNVENVDSLKFTIGHVDGSGKMNVIFKIYLDDKEYDNFELYRTMSLKEYEIDTSKAKVLRIVTSFNSSGESNSFALADFSVDSYTPSRAYTVPKYDSAADFMNSGFNISDVKVYDGTTKFPAFNMDSREFANGLVFSGDSEVNYNVENVDSLKFTIGHIDDSAGDSNNVTIYLDEKEYDELPLTGDMENIEYTIDTSKAKVLRIVTSYRYGNYAFGDISIVTKNDIVGDVNMDSQFNISDVVLLQRWLLADGTKLADWEAADLCKDGRLDSFDLCLMKEALLN